MLMMLTSVHHIYGAIEYKTPWRLHVLMLSVPVIVATLYLNRLLTDKEASVKSYWFWIYWTIVLLCSITYIGIFEGLYNHILKNVLYFGGLSKYWMNVLFPSHIYEMPDDITFEVTGIMQGLVTVPLVTNFIRLTLHHITRSKEQ
jgi:hypothetical protein